MELRRDLQNLIERAWGLHDGLTEEIKNINSCFCRLCSENGRYYNIVETPFQEKEGLVAIKDSLKEVANVLMILQEEMRTKTAGFVVCWIRMLFNRWRWQKAIGVAAKLILVSASVSSTVKFCHGEALHCCSSQRKALSIVEPVDSRTKENSTALSLSNRSLDVFYGRG